MTLPLWGILALSNIILGIVSCQFAIEGQDFTDVPLVQLSTKDITQASSSHMTTVIPTSKLSTSAGTTAETAITQDMTTVQPGPPTMTTETTKSESTNGPPPPIPSTIPPSPPLPSHQTCAIKMVKTVIKIRWFKSEKEVIIPTCSGHCLTGTALTKEPFRYEARANCCMPDESTVSEKRIELLDNETDTRANFTMKSFTQCKCGFFGEEVLDEYRPERVRKRSEWDWFKMWKRMFKGNRGRQNKEMRNRWRDRDSIWEDAMREDEDYEERVRELNDERQDRYYEERKRRNRDSGRHQRDRSNRGRGRRNRGTRDRNGGRRNRNGGRGRRY